MNRLFLQTIPIAAAGSMMVASCTHQIEEMAISVAPDGTGQFLAKATAGLNDNDVADLENSADYKKAEDIKSKLDNCGARTRLYNRGKILHVDVSSDFENEGDLRSILTCVPTSWKGVTFNISKTDGFLFDGYEMRFSIYQNMIEQAGSTRDVTSNRFDDFPKELKISVPGYVDDVTDRSDMMGIKLDIGRPDSHSVIFSYKPAGKAELQERLKYQEDLGKRFKAGSMSIDEINSRQDKLDVTIRSSEKKYNIDNILSFVAIFFGSGLVIEVFRRASGKK